MSLSSSASCLRCTLRRPRVSTTTTTRVLYPTSTSTSTFTRRRQSSSISPPLLNTNKCRPTTSPLLLGTSATATTNNNFGSRRRARGGGGVFVIATATMPSTSYSTVSVGQPSLGAVPEDAVAKPHHVKARNGQTTSFQNPTASSARTIPNWQIPLRIMK